MSTNVYVFNVPEIPWGHLGEGIGHIAADAHNLKTHTVLPATKQGGYKGIYNQRRA